MMAEMRLFTEKDVVEFTDSHRIYTNTKELVYDPPEWMKFGRRETATGYGAKLNSGLKICFNGRLYRIYITIFSNSGTQWFVAKGRKIIVENSIPW